MPKVLLILSQLALVTSFCPKGFLCPGRQLGLRAQNDGDWKSDGLLPDSTPKITQDVIDVMEKQVTTTVTNLAIDTVSFYMLEFRNEVMQHWMVGFANYSTNGFPDNDWTIYLEQMIKTPDQTIEVILKPPKQFVGKTHGKVPSHMVIQYEHDIEPRKVANQILTVRENVCEELINDLHLIEFENNEASRYATIFATEGKEAADKQRKMTTPGSSGSTPNRNRNYQDITKYLTDYAIEIIRKDLTQRQEMATIQYFDTFMEKLKTDYLLLSISDQFMNKFFGPRTILEQLYIQGITSSVATIPSIDQDTSTTTTTTTSNNNNVNILKLVKSIADTRWALATQVLGMLRQQNSNNRKYYKMIKDHGGVLSLGSKTKRSKFNLVDLNDIKNNDKSSTPTETTESTLSHLHVPKVTVDDSVDSSSTPPSVAIDVPSKNLVSPAKTSKISTSRTEELQPVAKVDTSYTREKGYKSANYDQVTYSGSSSSSTSSTTVSSSSASVNSTSVVVEEFNLFNTDFGNSGPILM